MWSLFELFLRPQHTLPPVCSSKERNKLRGDKREEMGKGLP
jgi:hypothetical protein